MSGSAWRFYVVFVYFPALLIGAALSVVMLPIVIGWTAANDLFDWSHKRIEREVANG